MARPYRGSHEDMVKAQRVIEFALESLKLLSLFKSVTLNRERKEIESLHENLKFLQDFIKLWLECSSRGALHAELVVEILEAADALLVATDSSFHSNLSDTSLFLRYSPRVADTSLFLRYSPRVADLVGKIRGTSLYSPRIADLVKRIRETLFCADQRTAPRLVVTRDGLGGDLLAMRYFPRQSPRVSDLVQRIISLQEMNNYSDTMDYYSDNRLVVTDSGYYCFIANANPLFHYSPLVADFVQRIIFSEEKDNIFPVQGSILVADKYGNFCNVCDLMHFLQFSPAIVVLVEAISSIAEQNDASPKGESILVIKNSGFYYRLVCMEEEIDAVPNGQGISELLGFGYNELLYDTQFCSFKDEILVVNCSVIDRCMLDERRKIRSTEDRIPDGPNIEGGSSSSESSSSQQGTSVVEKIVVGFEEETTELRNRLVRGSKLLQVIPITGMAGIEMKMLQNEDDAELAAK